MNTQPSKKPFDLLCVEETDLLKSNLINIIQNSELPISVTRLVLNETYRELMAAIEQALQKESQEYFTKLSEAAAQDTQGQSEPGPSVPVQAAANSAAALPEPTQG